MVRSCCVKVCNSELHDRKGQKLTTKTDILGLTLEKKTKQQEASDGLGCSGENAKSSYLSTYLRLCSFTHIHMLFRVINVIKPITRERVAETVMYHEMSCNRFMHRCKELFYFTNVTEIKYCFWGLYLTQV